jgi:hypothetical protein
MPDLPVKDSPFSAMHLPEFKRDDIVRSLSEIRLPDATKLEVPDAVAKFEWPRVDLSSIDVPKALAGVAAAANIGRRARRPRWPFAVGGLIIAGAVVAVLSNDGVRTRLAKAVNGLRDRITAMRPPVDDDILEIDVDDPIAFDAAETAAIAPPPYTETTSFDATGYPDGLGADNGDRMPAESAKPS